MIIDIETIGFPIKKHPIIIITDRRIKTYLILLLFQL